MNRLPPIAIDSRTTSDLHQDLHFTLQKVCSCCHRDFHENAVYECSPLSGLTEFVNRKGVFLCQLTESSLSTIKSGLFPVGP